jgi:hypothetical protein
MQPSICSDVGARRLETPAVQLMGAMERVTGIEPSYSAWKSANFLNVFKSRSDIPQLLGD